MSRTDPPAGPAQAGESALERPRATQPSRPEPASGTAAGPVRPRFRIGYDLGPVGTGLRLLLGVALSGWFLAEALASDVAAAGPAGIAGFAAWLAAITAGYFVAFWWLGPRLSGRGAPWIATALFYGPVLLSAYLDLPATLDLALGVYVVGSTLVTVRIGYGGCEVIAIPMLLLGRRQVVYCPWNLHADAVDKMVADGPLAGHTARIGVRVAAAIAVAAVLVGLSGVGGLPHLTFELRWIVAGLAGIATVAAWATAARLLARTPTPETRS